MPQIFQILRCYKCSVFQVHQTKKPNKYQCKMCGEKQSIKRHYGLGNGQECRLHVQKLNAMRGEAVEEMSASEDSDSDFEYHNKVDDKKVEIVNSKWTSFLDKDDVVQEPSEHLYSESDEVNLDQPKNISKRKSLRQNRHVPYEKLRDRKIFAPPVKDGSLNNINSTNNKQNNAYTELISKVKHKNSKEIDVKHSNEDKSKWIQFIDHQENVEPSEQLCIENSKSISNCAQLFQLCNDGELDDILNI